MTLTIFNRTITSVLWWFVSLSSLYHLSLGHGGNEEHRIPKLIILSFDGFRWDYLSRVETPNFDRIIKNGVRAMYGMKPSFVTKTFPNHFTLVTGLYEESHGVVANEMFDPVLNETFENINDTQNTESKWYDMGAEPIWVTNQVQKLGGRSGCMMWVGCAAPIKGIKPTRHVPYTPTMSNETRIDETLSWFTHAAYPVNLGLIYFSEPDETAHRFGPDSPQVTDMIAGVDKVIGYLLSKLEEADMLEDTNVIIISDHGFATTPEDKVINLDDYINPSTYRVFSVTPVASILPNEGMEDQIFSALSAGAEKTKIFSVYKKDSIPEQYHYTHNRRIMPILVVANDNYSIVNNGAKYNTAGNHGYNNSLPDMHALFVAMGPGFKKGAEIRTFNNEDVYPLMCHLLGLKPAPNNGSLDALQPLLAEEEEEHTTIMTFATYLFVLIVVATVGGVFSVAACRQHRYLKRQQRSRVINLSGGIRYSTPPVNGGSYKVPLLEDTSDEETMIH